MTHRDHPGFDAHNCPARMTIYAAAYAPTSNGYSCKVTGGHCLPGSNCPKLLEILKAKDKETSNRIEKREELIDQRTKLMAIVDQEREENKKNGVKHLSLKSRKILDRIWNIDETIMYLTES